MNYRIDMNSHRLEWFHFQSDKIFERDNYDPCCFNISFQQTLKNYYVKTQAATTITNC